MVGLVDYHSSDSEQQEKPTRIKKKIFIPKSIIPNPNQTTSTSPKQLKSNKRTATSGLASQLPPPKRIQTNKSNHHINHESEQQQPNQQQQQQQQEQQQQQQPNQTSSDHHSNDTPLNLFNLPTTTTTTTTTSITPDAASKTQSSSLFCSAPQLSEEIPPEPNLLDPYPGYWQRKDGSWVQRDPNEPIWKQFYLKHYHHDFDSNGNINKSNQFNTLPKDFLKYHNHHDQFIEFNAKKEAQLAWENKPKILDPRVEARQLEATTSKPTKVISARARGRHQLTSLLTDAKNNREELEDRISRGKLNRKAGGAKYGF